MTTVEDTELASQFERLSNWGRWGPHDERGTLNLITPDTIVASVGLIQTGVRISCSRPLKIGTAVAPGTEFLHHMLTSGDEAPQEGFASTADWFAMGCHGYEYTHLDSPAHIVWNGAMYNGFPASQISTSRGALRLSVDEAGDGIAGRAILVDGPTIKNKPWVEPGELIEPGELDAWCERIDVRATSGDILAVRFGRDEAERNGVKILGEESPGLSLDCLDWLHHHDIAVLMSDTISDGVPSATPNCRLPVHVVSIASMGMWIVDNAAFGLLAETCKEQERWVFFLTMAPLMLRRSTGSPLNPIAIF